MMLSQSLSHAAGSGALRRWKVGDDVSQGQGRGGALPPKVPPEGYDGWSVRMVLEYLAGDGGMFEQYDPKAGKYRFG